MWSPKLVRYGKKPRLHARVNGATVSVVATRGRVVEKIRHSEFSPVEVRMYYVHANGYLQACITRELDDSSWIYLNSLDRAEKGERPPLLDNSSFTKVDPSLAGQEVVVVEINCGDGAERHVYSSEGEVIPSLTRHPLSFARWAPESAPAKYGVID